MPISLKKSRFVEEFLIDLNASAAAIRAGYSAKTSRQIGYVLKNEPAVAAAIEQAVAERSQRSFISADRILREYGRVAFASITDAVSWDADGIVLKPSAELDAETAAAIVEVSETQTGRQRTIRVKLADKLGALRMDPGDDTEGIQNDTDPPVAEAT